MPQVLSIQSHVAHGYVGNKAAVFPLQLHGFDVDPINTVSLSNHSGYPVIKGHRMSAEEFDTIISGMRENHFLSDYDYLLTGYINSASIIEKIGNLLEELNARNHNEGGKGHQQEEGPTPPSGKRVGIFTSPRKRVVFLCDPVMGDDGRLYCKEEVVEAYRRVLPMADIATPNYFEASVLSGINVVDMSSACLAADWFHERGTRHVIIKGFPLPEDDSKLQFLLSSSEKEEASGQDHRPPLSSDENTTPTATSCGAVKRYYGTLHRFQGRYTGTGDVFAAVFLAFFHKHDITEAVSLGMGVLQDLIQATFAEGGTSEASLMSRELKVTHAVDSLLSPKTKVKIEPLV